LQIILAGMVKQFVLLFIALNTVFISSSFANSTIIHSEFLPPLAKQIYTFTDTLKADTIAIPTVQIKGYFVPQILHKTTASIGLISKNTLFAQPSHQMVHAFNTVPGVRMEERSPGSYRLSIRGSLLRSPFGIRNIKVYLDEIPLTDAGGNTYLNLIDPVILSNIEVLKGPDGSVFGANSGGAVLLNTTQATDHEPKEITFQAQ
jgi:iron complex outermembrane receptor protein